MKSIKRIILTALLFSSFALHSYATWSIIVIDPKTKEIGIAGASCTYSVYGIGAIAPGKGAIVVQAMSNPLARIKGFKMIMAGARPEDILKTIKDPQYFPEQQQYAIICMNNIDNPVTYTGDSTTANKGALTAKGISVQGNTLTDAAELQAALDAALKAQKDSLPIQDVLMLALEAGAKLGGDKRCGQRKASSAFLTVAKQNDDLDTPSTNLVVYGTDTNVHAVDALRKQYNAWKKKQED